MHYHIVGIAGAGMSAIATVLLDQGHTVRGSDIQTNRLTAALAERGATIHVGHDPSHVRGADAVVATAAVPHDHAELAAARAAGIPILKRTDLWRNWSSERSIIAVAGTHGKTTTTAMIAFVLVHAGIDAGYMIGSEVAQLGAARWGSPSAPLVIEADEYDHAFLGLTPTISIVTCIEWDHPDIFPSDAMYRTAFATFLKQTTSVAILSEQVERAAEGVPSGVSVVTYGFGNNTTYRAVETAQPSHWAIVRQVPEAQDTSEKTAPAPVLHLAIPGVHNVRNALAAISVADRLGLNLHDSVRHLAMFQGTARRFEIKGETGGVTVVDDYAHHPTEVMATLAAARSAYPGRRIVAYVQPHTFSRTEALLDQWSTAFKDADLVLIGSIYASREQRHIAQNQNDTPQCDPRESLSRELVQRVSQVRSQVVYAGTIEEAIATLLSLLSPGDVLLTMGAGDGFRVGEGVLQA